MKIRHYYHVFAAGAWEAPVRDHFTALGRAGLDDMAVTVGLVGSVHERKLAKDGIIALARKWSVPEPARWVEADAGWEQVTLNQVHADVHEIPGQYAVLYMHAKGAFNNSDANAAWRRSMTAKLVGDWERCIRLLDSYDAVGCHWITQFNDWFFAGNFWWATASHLRALPVPENQTRWTPEVWVSLGACPSRRGTIPYPKIRDLLPGWPAYGGPPGVMDDQQAMSTGQRATVHPPGQEPQGHFL